MQHKQLIMGLFQVNNYILFDKESNEIILIDAGGDFEQTCSEINEFGGKLKYILHTHAHMDHIAGDYDIQKKFNIPVYIHKDDEEQIPFFKDYLKAVGMPDYNTPKDIIFFDNDKTFNLGNNLIKVIHTPGHTQGGVAYFTEDKLFSGDSLFFECIGRTDLFGGNHEQLVNSVKSKLLQLPDNTIVYPGHGKSTTIKHEKLYNGFV